MQYKQRFTLIGLGIGAFLILIAWSLSISQQGLEWSFDSVVRIHQDSHVFFIVELMTFVLALVFHYLGRAESAVQVFTTGDLDESAQLIKNINETSSLTWLGYFIAFLFSTALLIGAWNIDKRFFEDEQGEVRQSLGMMLGYTAQTVDLLVDEQISEVRLMANSDSVRTISQHFLTLQDSAHRLSESVEQTALRRQFANSGGHEIGDYFIIVSPDGTALAATSDSGLGPKALYGEGADFLGKVFDGNTALCASCSIDVELLSPVNANSQQHVKVTVGLPIRNASGQVIAALVYQFSFHDKLLALLSKSPFGGKGRVYAYDKNGHVITADRLVAAGSASAQESAPEVRQPRSGATGGGAFNTGGYTNHLGIEVLAAWQWRDHQNVGFLAEIPTDEALSNYYFSRMILYISVAALIGFVFLTLSIVVKYIISSRRVELFTRRTAQKTRALLDGAAEGIYGINTEGQCTFANQSCLKMTGYHSEADMVGKNMHTLLHHSHRDKTDYPSKDCSIYHGFKNGRNVHVDDEVFWRADGSCFDVEYNSNVLSDGEIITGAVVSFSDISERRKREERRAAMLVSSERYKKALDEISTAGGLISSTEGPFHFFATLAKIVAVALDAEQVGVWRFTNNRQSLIADCRYRLSEDRSFAGEEITEKDHPAFFAVAGKQMISVSDVSTEPHRSAFVQEYLIANDIKSFMSIPIIVHGSAHGLLNIGRTGDCKNWDDIDLEFAYSVGLTLALAMETVQRISTEHRQAEIVKTMVDGLVTIDVNGIIESFNPAAQKIFGYSEKEAIGNDIKMLMMESTIREQLSSYIVRYKKRGKARILGQSGVEVMGRHKSGRELPIAISISEMTIGNRRIFSSIVRDISDERQLRQEREAALLELTKLIDNANAPIFGVNTKLQVVEWNQFMENMTGYDKTEVEACLFIEELIEEEKRPAVELVLRNALAGKLTSNFEAPFIAKGGSLRNVLLSASPRLDSSGTIIGVLGVGQDITELKETEETLGQAQRMEAVGQLTGGIAHDFNNLLSIIQSNLRFVQDKVGKGDPDFDELFEDAFSAVDDGAELTKRLLAFARTRALEHEVIEANESIAKFVRFVSRTIGVQYDLTVDSDMEDLYLDIDRSQFDNALLNLILNARDAMPGSGLITIGIRRVDLAAGAIAPSIEAGQYARIDIIDHGVGIKAEHIRNVFEPFFTTKELGKGTGLGLSMVYGFMLQSRGACQVKSTSGEGTTVSLFFPLTAKRPLDKTKTKTKTKGISPTAKPSEVILVVEDDVRVRRATLRDLRRLGYRTIEAEHAAMAQSIISSGESVDLVFSDIVMPGEMDGFALAQWVEENHANIKVVLTSGFSDRKREESAGGRFPIVRKPYAADSLATTIATALSN